MDEQALAHKVCGQSPLSLEEIFTIKQLFDYYLVEIKERDSRVYKAICLALITQREQKIIDENRFIEELQALSEWYASAKGLYNRIDDNWVATSLEKRLKEDQEKRQTDPQHQLRFVRNEIYEERLQNLKRRQMVVTACCVAGLVFCALLGIVFFCRSAKGNRLM